MQNLKMPYREQNSNKGTFGRVLNVSGSDNYVGAAYLSSLAALKIGAGYVFLSSCEKVCNSISIMLPEVVCISDSKALENFDNYTVMLIGCGLGKDKKGKKTFENFIKEAVSANNKPIVVDADGLNLLSCYKEEVRLPENIILTPHPIEAARLLGIEPKYVLDNMEAAARQISEKYSCVTVLKSHRTIICDKNLDVYVNTCGNSALAKAGSGDVLAGIITGLLAQKMDVCEAAKLGVYLHAKAGEIASEELTEYSVLASDLPKYLPQAIKTLQ